MSAARERWQLARFGLGRAIIHMGLRILPAGRVQSELYALIDQWATRVRETVFADDAQTVEGGK